MLNTSHPQPIKDIVYACQSLLHWHDEFCDTQLWEAGKNEAMFFERIRELVPQCLDLLKNDVSLLDCE